MHWLGPKPTFFKGDVPFSTAECLRARALRRRSDRTEPTEQYLFVNFISLLYRNDPAGLGAMRYVAKTNAGIELLAAVEAVSQGRRIVSAGLVRAPPAERQVPARPDAFPHHLSRPFPENRKFELR